MKINFSPIWVIIFLCSNIFAHNLSAQIFTTALDSKELSYESREISYVYLPNGTNFDDIHPYDIPLLQQQEIHKSFHYSLDENDNPQIEINILNAKNSPESWEGAPNQILINQDGTTSNIVSSGQSEEISVFPHSPRSRALYLYNKDKAIENGFGSNFVFPKDIESNLSQFGVEYKSPSKGIYEIDNERSTVSFDANSKKTTEVLYKRGKEGNIDYDAFQTKTIKLYDTSDGDIQLLTSSIQVVEDTLTNGLCIQRVTETHYSNYQYGRISKRSVDGGNDKKEIFSDFSIYPNPLNSDLLFLNFPNRFVGKQVEITLLTIDGIYINCFSAKLLSNKFPLNLSEYNLQTGLYLVNIKSDSDVFSRKFYFVNN